MRKITCLMTVMLLGIPTTGHAETPPVKTVGGVALPGVPVEVTERKAARVAYQPKAAIDESLYTETRIGLTVEPGTTEVVPVSRNFLNKIITPFENPKLISISDIDFKKQGSSLFVATASEAPVGIHILSNDPADTRSISLALVPRAIPPRTIHLKWPGGQSMLAPGRANASAAKAERWELSTPYVETLMELFSLIARGEVPPGYSLEQTPADNPCSMPGEKVSLYAGQRLTGSRFSVYVMRATNTGSSAMEIVQNAGCRINGVVAVAPWPNAYLKPGESTEMYVGVVNEQYEAREQPNLRPSLLRQTVGER